MLMTITHHLHTGRVFSYGFYWRLKCQILIVERTGHARQGKSYSPFFFLFSFLFLYVSHSFKTQPGGSIWDPTDPGLEPGRVEEKTQCDPVKNPVASCWLLFLLKRRRFDLKKKIYPDNSVNRSKPGTRALDQTGSKNYDIYIYN
jgi:hypothetical protein